MHNTAPSHTIDATALVNELRSGNRLMLSRTISRVENQSDAAPALLAALYPFTGGAPVSYTHLLAH